MTDHRPPPLVDPEVNMGANDFFPFYFDRLRKSRWWRRASDVAKARNVTMWGEAYKGSPAGSLPDDDDELAEAAGYGFDVERFLEHKEEIMAPWQLCSDGRWYHPVVCEVVLETWERTSEKRKQDRARQASRRARIRGHTQHTAAAAPERVTHDREPVTRDEANVAREIRSQDKTGQDTTTSVASASLLATVGGKQSHTKRCDALAWKADQEFCAFWDICTPESRTRIKGAKAREAWLKARHSHDAATILGAYRAYLSNDPDVKRTGGPGVHIWLRDRLDIWAETVEQQNAPWSAGRWAAALRLWKESGEWDEASAGPKPGTAACRVPQAILAAAGLGLRVVAGSAA